MGKGYSAGSAKDSTIERSNVRGTEPREIQHEASEFTQHLDSTTNQVGLDQLGLEDNPDRHVMLSDPGIQSEGISVSDAGQPDVIGGLTLYRLLNDGTMVVPVFGDGRGTGVSPSTRGPEEPPRMMKVKWSPITDKYTSNAKELATLRLVFQTLTQSKEDISGMTVFYFTDNLVAYYACGSGSSKTPELHALVEDIKQLEEELGIQLKVVHAPGLAIVEQGSGGLRLRIWVSSLHHCRLSQEELTASIFDLTIPASDVIDRVISQIPCVNKVTSEAVGEETS